MTSFNQYDLVVEDTNNSAEEKWSAALSLFPHWKSAAVFYRRPAVCYSAALICGCNVMERTERGMQKKTGAGIMRPPQWAFNWKSEINMLMSIGAVHWQGYLRVTVLSAIATLSCRRAFCFLIKIAWFHLTLICLVTGKPEAIISR